MGNVLEAIELNRMDLVLEIENAETFSAETLRLMHIVLQLKYRQLLQQASLRRLHTLFVEMADHVGFIVEWGVPPPISEMYSETDITMGLIAYAKATFPDARIKYSYVDESAAG